MVRQLYVARREYAALRLEFHQGQHQAEGAATSLSSPTKESIRKDYGVVAEGCTVQAQQTDTYVQSYHRILTQCT